MVKKFLMTAAAVLLAVSTTSCLEAEMGGKGSQGTGGEVKLITLDPGHFHAALVQKKMYDQVSPTVHVFAPAGSDVQDHLNRIDGYNTRAEDPTQWKEIVYTGDDFLEKMLAAPPGNVVALSGNNRKKTEYIKACVDAGLNVFSDKPMCVTPENFELLKAAFASAQAHGVLLYDIMTERSEITTILQKELANNSAVFGRLRKGTPDDPAIVKESVHHFFKYVSGNPIKRPGWYFDTTQQGEGIVDVTTHLVDLVMWGAFPEQVIDYEKDIQMVRARRWPTIITKEQYAKVTRLEDFPPYLKDRLNPEGVLPCYANGEMVYAIKGVSTKISVMWNFEAPEGTQDTHYSIMKGTKCNLVIRQGKEQNYRPELYVEPAGGMDDAVFAKALVAAVDDLAATYPGVRLRQQDGSWLVSIPDEYRIGHEAHFGQVTDRYLQYLADGKLPDWEAPNMIAKYYVTTAALQMATE
jgi:predicted dehydrogenase